MTGNPLFGGNGVFMENGSPVLPDNAISRRMWAGDFGPFPNNTAPQGYRPPPPGGISPAMMASALRSSLLPNIAGAAPPAAKAPAPAAPSGDPIFLPDRSW